MKASDMAQYLEDQGHGTVGTDIFYSFQPDTPDACITVLDTGGLAPDRYIPHAEPTFQVLVRSTTYDLAEAKAEAIVTELHDSVHKTIGGDYHYYIFLLTEPAAIGRDENGRDEISINFVTKHRR